ncbi:hypothetical protein NK718_00025 [Alsobacter sp. SYSU M60028]|uniref:Baseplate protein J-like domain-containing protein n=1 Tax=Alsobacter ponti TaxID=2962936 RepID=A0ABT1L680_9HYPH|nr:hypothetical protein [Alsobacter ponti]MCP8936889.1 hypothetical protein [Alsobacter ponti]
MSDFVDEAIIRFELNNTKPVDLLDLTQSLSAFAEAYLDHAVSAGFEPERGNVRLAVKAITTGSIIADLASYSEQASIILKHVDVAAGFLTHFNEIAQFFLGKRSGGVVEPARREAENVMKVFEPVAKDGGSNLILQTNGPLFQVNGPMTINFNFNSQEANAIQNAARRFLGPRPPLNQIEQDLLLTLHQVRGDAASKVGDRGIIESVSLNPVKLLFASEEVKKAILDEPYPFRKVFLVDAEIRAAEGKPALYRILTVKDVIKP